MLVVDATHKSVSDFDHVYFRAASSRFVPMVLDIVTPQTVCEKRMVAALEALGCTEGSLKEAKDGFISLASTWEKTPEWMATLDLSWLAAEASDCNMEDDFGAAEAMAQQEVYAFVIVIVVIVFDHSHPLSTLRTSVITITTKTGH